MLLLRLNQMHFRCQCKGIRVPLKKPGSKFWIVAKGKLIPKSKIFTCKTSTGYLLLEKSGKGNEDASVTGHISHVGGTQMGHVWAAWNNGAQSCSGQVTHTCQVLPVQRVWAAEHPRGQLRNCLSSRWILTFLSQEMQGLPLEVVFVFDLIVTVWMIKKSEQSSLPLTLMRHHRVQTGTECQVHPRLFSSYPPLPSFFCGTIVVGITYALENVRKQISAQIFSNLYADTQINNWGFSERRGGIGNVQMWTRDTLQKGNGSLVREVSQKLKYVSLKWKVPFSCTDVLSPLDWKVGICSLQYLFWNIP